MLRGEIFGPAFSLTDLLTHLRSSTLFLDGQSRYDSRSSDYPFSPQADSTTYSSNACADELATG